MRIFLRMRIHIYIYLIKIKICLHGFNYNIYFAKLT